MQPRPICKKVGTGRQKAKELLEKFGKIGLAGVRGFEVTDSGHYNTKNHGQRVIHKCNECEIFFSSTINTFLAGIKKPISLIIKVIKSRTEGLGLNAACRTFEIAKNTIIDWEMRFLGIKQTLTLYALVQSYLKLTIEGDEVYTRVGKNVPPDDSIGWTVVLMDLASRFLWELQCGKKDRKLFRKALRTLNSG